MTQVQPQTQAQAQAQVKPRASRRRRPLLPPESVTTREKAPPTVMAAKLVLALLRGQCAPTGDGVASYLGVYRSTAFRLLSRLVEAGILTRRKERRDRIPPLWVYSVAMPVSETNEQGEG